MNKNELAKRCVEAMTLKDKCTQKMGIEILEITAEKITVKMKVTQEMLNGFESCHGGQIFTLADSTFAFACNVNNEITVAAGCDINFINPAYLGDILSATSKKIHASGRLGIYDVEIVNQNKIVVAQFRGRSYTMKGKNIIKNIDNNE